jgi:hypothetical protein
MKKWEMNRRTFLKASGVSLALPLLDAMIPSFARAANGRTQRFVCIYLPNAWLAAPGYAYQPQVMNVLNTIRADLTMVSGLRTFSLEQDHADHIEANQAFLQGSVLQSDLYPAGRQTLFDINKMPRTVDQQIADMNRGSKNAVYPMCPDPNPYSPFPGSLSNNYAQTMSWEGPGKPAQNYTKPSQLFTALFGAGAGTPMPPAPETNLNPKRISVLHYVMDQVKSTKAKVGRDDQIRLDEYFTGIEELEKKIANTANPPPVMPPSCSQPSLTMNDTDYEKRLDLYYEIAFYAFQCDLTRVFTCLHATEGNDRQFNIPGVKNTGDGWHTISHFEGNTDRGASFNDLAIIEAWHHNKIVNFVKRLKGGVQANGQSLLSETAVVWGHGMTNKNVQNGSQHHYSDLRMNVAGSANGAFKMGINVDAKGQHLSNFWLTLLQAYGVNSTQFGHSTGALSGLRV